MTYFHGRAVHYHRRKGVSRSCSGWEGVVPPRYGRQAVEGRPAALGNGPVFGSKHTACDGVMSWVLGCACGHGVRVRYAPIFLRFAQACNLQGYRIKPHGQLVLVS